MTQCTQKYSTSTAVLVQAAELTQNPVTKRTLLNIIQRRRAAVLAIDIMKGDTNV